MIGVITDYETVLENEQNDLYRTEGDLIDGKRANRIAHFPFVRILNLF